MAFQFATPASGHGGDDDLYEGFNYSIEGGAASSFSFAGNPGPVMTGAPPSANPFSFNRGPPSSMGRMMTGRMTGRLGTGQQAGADPRPMTSVKGAGYQSKQPGTASGNRPFDPLNQTASGPAPALLAKDESSPEDVARSMEKQVNDLIEASAAAAVRGDSVQALERAKEAGKKERALGKHREQHNLIDQINLDLTYSVCFNLAHCYHLNGMYTEALSTYSLIVKNKQYPQAGRLRVNMGNIYFEQEQYPMAVKMYRMALDQIPNTGKEVRLKIMRNIGNAFVRMGQFQDAIQSYETITESLPDFQTGFNLIVCYYALGEPERMKKGFQKLLTVPMPMQEAEDDEEEKGEEALQDKDMLKEEIRERHKRASTLITNAAKLIAPTLSTSWEEGYDWIIEQLRAEHDAIASEMQICKALEFMRNKNFPAAIKELKAFEKKDQSLKAKAATNLSFLYFLEGDIAQADKYANLAVKHDRYNARALVNKGNCLNEKGELERAKELYLEAIGVEADCVEAIYNLGLVNKDLGLNAEALQAFEKLHTIIPSSPEVLYHIGNLHDMLKHQRAAEKYFKYLIARVPSDPTALSRLAQIYSQDQDEVQAYHYHHEAYRHYPVNIDVISWLGVWFVKSEMYEKAIEFFERAAEIQPQEVKWRLMVTSCYRRMGNYDKAVELYEAIHHDHPDNLECLRYLVAICKDLGREHSEYEQKLIRLERAVSQQQGMTAMQTRQPVQQPQQAQSVPPQRYTPAAPAPSPSHSDDEDKPVHDSPERMPAPAASYVRPSAPQMNQAAEDEDDFADADLDQLLTD